MNTDKIFLADDDFDDCEFFEDALKSLCLENELTTAHDGKELMDILSEELPPPPKLIFLDLNMPRKNGFECLTEIRNTSKLKDIPVVVLTTSSDGDTVNKAYQLGANGYICKPGSFPDLKELISHTLTINWQEVFKMPAREKFIITL